MRLPPRIWLYQVGRVCRASDWKFGLTSLDGSDCIPAFLDDSDRILILHAPTRHASPRRARPSFDAPARALPRDRVGQRRFPARRCRDRAHPCQLGRPRTPTTSSGTRPSCSRSARSALAGELGHFVINDGLMTIFFFVVGLEIKRELVAGELRDPRKAALPVIAALGGMLVPAAIYLALQHGQARRPRLGHPDGHRHRLRRRRPGPARPPRAASG